MDYNSLNRSEIHGFVPRLARRRHTEAARAGILGLCAYTRYSDMLGRGRKSDLTNIDCVSPLSDLVLTESSRSLPSSSSHSRATTAINSALTHVNGFLKRLKDEFTVERPVECRGEVTCVWFVRGADCSATRREGINDVFGRLLISQHVRSASTIVVCNLTLHLVDLIWLLLRRLSRVILGVQALTSFFQVSNLNERISLVRLLSMVAWCEHTLTGTFTFGRFVGLSALCRSVGDGIGWENPFLTLNLVLGYQDELKLAQSISYNRVLIDKSITQVSNCFSRFEQALIRILGRFSIWYEAPSVCSLSDSRSAALSPAAHFNWDT